MATSRNESAARRIACWARSSSTSGTSTQTRASTACSKSPAITAKPETKALLKSTPAICHPSKIVPSRRNAPRVLFRLSRRAVQAG